jgi:Icc-related predicted phosphoesterase
MSDMFRRLLDYRCGGVGGVGCYCCNQYTKKEKSKLQRKVRRMIKNIDKKDLTNIN